MRTTLINTTFWKESSVDELHLDSKLLYLYMLTNPEKGLANLYHYKPKVISAYAGLSVEQVEISAKQLIELGYIDIFNGYYVLLKGHEMPKKGRFTDKTIEKEKELVPTDVLEHFNLLINQKSSGVAPEHNNKDNNIDKDNTKTKAMTNSGSNDINHMMQYWETVVGYAITSKQKMNRNACSNLLKRHGERDLMRVVEGVARSQDDRYAPRIADFIDLQAKWNALMVWGKQQTNQQKVTVIS